MLFSTIRRLRQLRYSGGTAVAAIIESSDPERDAKLVKECIRTRKTTDTGSC
jgi:hypothetical protein